MRFTLAEISAVVVALTCLGCYEPKGSAPLTKVEPTVPLNLTIVVTDTTRNIYLYDKVKLQYQISFNGKIDDSNNSNFSSRLAIVLDDRQLFPDPGTNNILTLDPTGLADGKHKLTFILDQNAQGSSLASKLGKEVFTTTKEITVTVDMALPSPVAIRKFQIIDGVMSIVWNKPLKSNFISYQIRRFYTNANKTQWFEYGSPIKVNKNALSFRDTTYAGGAVQYRVDVTGSKLVQVGIQRDTTIAILNPKAERTAIDALRVSWEKPVLYGVIKNIRVTVPTLEIVSFNPEVVSFTTPFLFGAPGGVSLSILPKYNSFINYFDYYQMFDASVSYDGLGKHFDQVVPFWFGSKEIISTITNDDTGSPLLTFYEVSSSTGKVLSSIAYNNKLSPTIASPQRVNYRVVPTPDNHRLYLFYGTQVLQFDNNLQFIKSIDITPAFGGQDAFAIPVNITVSNSGLAAFRTIRIPGNMLLFDLENPQVLYSASGSGLTAPAVSADGRYFADGGNVYSISGTNLNLISTTPSGTSGILQMLFADDNPDKLMIMYQTKIDFLDVPSGTVTSTFSPSPANLSTPFVYDASRKLLGVTNAVAGSPRQYLLYNTTTNILERTVAISNATVNLVGNELVSGSNVRYPL